MEASTDIDGYSYSDSQLNTSHKYLVPALEAALKVRRSTNRTEKLFDLGCGNGSVSAIVAGMGFEVSGVDPSKEGIQQAKTKFPDLKLEIGSAYDDLACIYGQHNFVISLEVVEHVFSPRKYAATIHSLLVPGGYAIVSTPYHGYLKNLALSVTGSFDKHFTALWDYGHIKFWSVKTLTVLFEEQGFKDFEFIRVGRIPPLAKSMVMIAKK